MECLILLIAIIAIIYLIVRVSSKKRWPTVFDEKLPEDKGTSGENSVASILRMIVRYGMYGHVLQNLYIPRDDGGTSEIDVLLISTKGLFVFESKNYAGYIFGDDEHRNWTVTLFAGKNWSGRKQIEKHQFYNPIWQNTTHIKYLRKAVKSPIPFYSVIVFSDRGKLKNLTYDPERVAILQTSQLRGYMQYVLEKYTDVVSAEGVDLIYARLLPFTQADTLTKTAHLYNIEKLKSDPEVCPWCGGKLVIRTAQKGPRAGKQFYGCSNYPECKYTRNIETTFFN